MRKWNWKLIAGLLLVFFFVVIAIIGPHVAPYEVNKQMDIKYIETENGEEMRAPPFPPSKEHLFGTDKWGYDILTLLLHGAKFTIFTVIIVALVRVMLGALLGILMALTKTNIQVPTKKIKMNVFSGFPIFIFIYFILIEININPILKPITLTLIVGSLLTLFGLPSVFFTVYGKTMEVKKSLYVVASQSIGGSKLHIAKKHILPSLRNHLVIIFVNEIIQVLHLIGQLGIFNLFVGGTILRLGGPQVYIPITKEWAGLIGQFRSFLYHSQWILLFPLLCFLVLLFSFYLISQGLSAQETIRKRRATYL
ncbi:ABC transporter permease [Bacillus sp. T33-2]|uniref:ABC transporter permease n=1 Tax=Bacillus sp. T33-2 TaxID=2054168 RepID=UPI000C777B2A|nr:ABC transporter permease [Bacillus sp. T33-2]PLR94432.1 peptide ABC transporter permease [Bacillus sp. T33-2]